MVTSKTSDSRATVWIVAATVLVLVALLGAWLLGWFTLGTDPRVQEILALQDQARERFAEKGGPTNLADATAAFTSMMEIRQKTEQLPPHLRPQAEVSGINAFRSFERGRIDRYFALPPAQRQAELDRQINQQELMRNAFEAGSAVMNAVGGGGSSSNQTAGPGGGGPSGGGPPWAARSEDDRNKMRKSMIIDRTSPEERARYTEYRRAVDARRQQRGLPSFGPR